MGPETITGRPRVIGVDVARGTLVHDPLGLLVLLLITGAYPVVVYLAYLCAGLAIGGSI